MKMKKIGPRGGRPIFYYVDPPLLSTSRNISSEMRQVKIHDCDGNLDLVYANFEASIHE